MPVKLTPASGTRPIRLASVPLTNGVALFPEIGGLSNCIDDLVRGEVQLHAGPCSGRVRAVDQIGRLAPPLV